MQHLRITTACLIALVTLGLNAQQFSFNMVFQDSLGNTDTLIFGYDPEATWGIDIEFGEENIHGEPIDTTFDVRVSDEIDRHHDTINIYDTFSLKKMIVKEDCDRWPTPIPINIRCDNWPVTAYWDSSLFYTECLEGSVFTSVHPGGWWDVGSASDLWRILLSQKSQVTFSTNIRDYAEQDSIAVFWVAMATKWHLFTSVESLDKKSIQLYPNPTDGNLYYDNKYTSTIDHLEIIDLAGTIHPVPNKSGTIETENLPPGIFLLRAVMSDQSVIIQRFIKQ
jgi:hypothetical protein